MLSDLSEVKLRELRLLSSSRPDDEEIPVPAGMLRELLKPFMPSPRQSDMSSTEEDEREWREKCEQWENRAARVAKRKARKR